jgi:hypothetical protein
LPCLKNNKSFNKNVTFPHQPPAAIYKIESLIKRLFAQDGDLMDLAGPLLWLREYKYPTRAATAGVLSQETEFANFVKKRWQQSTT